jgi:23S rRNA pseudouridine1911/1915/1917 synthase
MPATVYRFVVEPAEAGERLDRYLAARLPEVSRTRAQGLIAAGGVSVGGRAGRAATKLVAGDDVAVEIAPPTDVGLVPQSIPLRIVYEDADLIVVDKDAGLVVHPAPGHPAGTLVNALLAHTTDLAGIGGELRPGIVHRLDRDTSGLIVVAKHDRAHRMLAQQLRDRQMDKRYLALVDGGPSADGGTIDAPIGRHPAHTRPMAVVATGRPATTRFRVLKRFPHHTYVECHPITGRTHQIRVHLAAIGCPIAGDRMYGRRQTTVPLERHFLHAARLTFTLPSGAVQTFEAPLPADLERVLSALEAT